MTEAQEKFFLRLDSLGTGDRAALLREAGVMLQQAKGPAVTAFFSCLPSNVQTWQEERWFAVACLRCLWDAGDEGGRPFELVVADLVRSGELSDSTKHRVELLLDTEWDEDGYMLIKLARLLKLVRQKSDRARLDFAALLDDLLGWNSDKQYVQRKWARAIFSSVNQTEIDEKEN